VDAKIAHSTWDHHILYADTISKDEQLLIRSFARNQKYEHGEWFKIKIHILFCGDNLRSAALRKIKFCTVKDMDIPASFI
jgi:hypothetical protein